MGEPTERRSGTVELRTVTPEDVWRIALRLELRLLLRRLRKLRAMMMERP